MLSEDNSLFSVYELVVSDLVQCVRLDSTKVSTRQFSSVLMTT